MPAAGPGDVERVGPGEGIPFAPRSARPRPSDIRSSGPTPSASGWIDRHRRGRACPPGRSIRAASQTKARRGAEGDVAAVVHREVPGAACRSAGRPASDAARGSSPSCRSAAPARAARAARRSAPRLRSAARRSRRRSSSPGRSPNNRSRRTRDRIPARGRAACPSRAGRHRPPCAGTIGRPNRSARSGYPSNRCGRPTALSARRNDRRCEHRVAAVRERRRKPDLRARVADQRLDGDGALAHGHADIVEDIPCGEAARHVRQRARAPSERQVRARIRPVAVLLELEPQHVERTRAVVGVADLDRAGERVGRGIERSADRVVGAVLPVLRPRRPSAER